MIARLRRGGWRDTPTTISASQTRPWARKPARAMATESLSSATGSEVSAPASTRHRRDAPERTMPGAIAAHGDDERDQHQRRAGRQHVQPEHARQPLIDEKEIEGQRQMPGAFADGDETGRDGKSDKRAAKGDNAAHATQIRRRRVALMSGADRMLRRLEEKS